MQEFIKLHPNDPKLHQFLSGKKISIFSAPVWNFILQEGFNVKAWYYCLRNGEEIVLALPGVLFDFKLVRVFYANMPYGEFIGDVKFISNFIDLIEEKLCKEKVHLIRIAQLEDGDFLASKGYHLRRGFQHLLDLNGVDPKRLIDHYKSSVRRNIRKAEVSQVSIREIKRKGELEFFYHLYLETMRRNKAAPVWTKKVFQAIYEFLVVPGQATIYFAEWKGEIIAGMILIHSVDTTSYFLGASGAGTHHLRPNDLLFHTAIRTCLEKGMRYFDFMTCSENDEELIRFKEKWGAKRLPFSVYEKELNHFRASLWAGLWKIANSKFGSILINRLFSSRHSPLG